MFRPMSTAFVSVSFLLFVSCVGLLTSGLKRAGAESLDKKVYRRRRNLRQRNNDRNKHRIGSNKHGGIENAEENSRSLIVGGSDAKNFPRSIVFLSDRVDDLQCGGTLISPTVVLAAGHCEVSLIHEAVFLRSQNGLQANSANEIRIKATHEILHPSYNRKNLQNDVMLVVLEKSPNEINGREISPPIVPYIKLHSPDDPSLQDILDGIEKRKGKHEKARKRLRNLFYSAFGSIPSLPDAPITTDLQLKALGWGHTEDGRDGEPSDFLQEVVLNWVQNEDCENAEENAFRTYENRISDDMMCTWRSGMDTCSGDSGGPVVIDNPSYKKNKENVGFQFVQVGIVSWGEDCADHIFPGVASRVSVAFDWIRDRVCSIDGSDAPSYLKCDGDQHTYSPAPTMSPTTSEDAIEAQLRAEGLVGDSIVAPEISVAVEIFMDTYSYETSWKLVEINTGSTLANVPYKEYKYENSIRKEFDLTMGNTYKFTIYDQYGDGILKQGSYRIYIVDNSKYETVGTILAKGEGDFGYKSERFFTVPKPGATKESVPQSRIGQLMTEPLP